MKYQLEISANRGYGADQITGTTVADLRQMLEGLEDDDVIITHDESNRYGASYGELLGYLEECEIEEDEEETETEVE